MKIKITEIEADARELRESNTLSQNLANLLSRCFQSVEPFDDDAVRYADNEVIELLPAVIDAILLEVPLQATEATAEDYPSGDGWRVISEEEYEKSRKAEIDPRLAKLKEWKEN